MFLSIFFTLIGCLLTGVQALLIYIQGEGVCFNEGCEIVDSLTLVDPLYFNLAGFFYFFILAIGLARARNGSDLWRRFCGLLLLAGLAAEGVLLAFQLIISQALCSYCLIILSLILLANLFMGLKQFAGGLVIFSAVLLASFSLDYHGGAVRPQPLETGTMARLQPDQSDKQIYLFISSTCKHCQSVLTLLENSRGCTINFNPVDAYHDFSFPGADLLPDYLPAVNLGFLKRLGIHEIPVLLHQEGPTMTLVRGEQAIAEFIDRQCSGTAGIPRLPEPVQMSSSYQLSPLPIGAEEDGCTIEQVCDDPTQQSPGNLP
jgi:uncharacterized membrane protein